MIKTLESKKENIIEELKENNELRNRYITLLQNDYIYYKSLNCIHYFVKRSHFPTIYSEVLSGNLFSNNGQIYSLESADVRPSKLLVIFGSMPDAKKYNSSSVANRMFVKNTPHVRKYIPDDVLIIRFFDLNMHTGSFYMNTGNNPKYEENIYKTIKLVAANNNISNKDILFFGASKGATASLYYGLKFGIYFIASDPILSLVNSDTNRLRLCFTTIDYLKEKFDNGLNTKNSKGIIVCSSNVVENYHEVIKFTKNRDKIKIVNNCDKRINNHTDIMPYSQKYI